MAKTSNKTTKTTRKKKANRKDQLYSKPTRVNKKLSELYPHDYIDDRIKVIEQMLTQDPEATFLDIGCSNGYVTSHLAKQIGTKKVHGVDVANVSQAKKHGVSAKVHDLNQDKKLPYKKNFFDVITCLDTLEHVYNTDHVVEEIQRILKPGGYAIISVPRTDSLLNVALLLLGFQMFSGSTSLEKNYGAFSKNRISGHMAHFTKKALLEICAEYGLKPVDYREASFAGAWLGDQKEVTGVVDLKKQLTAAVIRMIPFKKEIAILKVSK